MGFRFTVDEIMKCHTKSSSWDQFIRGRRYLLALTESVMRDRTVGKASLMGKGKPEKVNEWENGPKNQIFPSQRTNKHITFLWINLPQNLPFQFVHCTACHMEGI